MFDGLNNAHNSIKPIFSQTSSIFLLKVKARQVCTGIGHRLPIIDSFPSLLGALHIGPILVALALLAGQGGQGGQLVSVSSPISTSLEAKRETEGRFKDFPEIRHQRFGWLTWPSLHSRPVTGGVSGSLAVTTLSRQHLPNALRSVERGVVEVIFEIDGWDVVK